MIKEPHFDMLHGDDGLILLHNLPSYSEKVWRLLLKNCGDCINKTDSKENDALHVWAADKNGEWLCKLLLEISQFPKARAKIFGNLICSPNLSDGNTPLHVAVGSQSSANVVQCYRQYTSENHEVVSVECPPPWKIRNKFGETTLHIALHPYVILEEFAVEMLSVDPNLRRIGNNNGESPFFLAVRSGCERAVEEEVLRMDEACFNMLRHNDGQTVLYNLPHF